MAGPVVPTLAPHVNVLATIVGTPLDLLHFVIRGGLGLGASLATPSYCNGYHWTLTSARGALRCGSLRRDWSWFPLFFSRGGRDLVSLLRNAARGRRPRCLITPCRGPRPGLVSSQALFGGYCHGHNRGLLHGLLAAGLVGGILVSNCRLGCSQVGNVARINIRGRTNKEEIMQNYQKKGGSAEDMF